LPVGRAAERLDADCTGLVEFDHGDASLRVPARAEQWSRPGAQAGPG
jgi:hypothetical protein